MLFITIKTYHIMKRKLLILAALLFCTLQESFATDLKTRLEQLPSVRKVETLQSEAFPEKYLLYFEQPIDHKHPSKGTFTQRVVVCNVSTDSSSVVVCEGYGAAYAFRNTYRDELSRVFNLNNIVVEHRYFLESTPQERDWKYLTAENEANDLHRIVTELKSVFPHKWISTGISKGGQNATIYRAFFPHDVDFSVPYVGPFCRARQDGRHEPFIAEYVGTPQQRATVQAFQTEFLKRREALMPKFKALCQEKGYEFRIPIDEVYDMCALEMAFAFWQWGTSFDRIPATNASDDEIFNAMMAISGPDYFIKDTPSLSFYVMAAKELGYYGYDVEPFKEYLTITTADKYLERIFLPDDFNGKFSKKLSRKMERFIKKTDERMLFIYGQFDPWSSARAGDDHKENVHIFIDPEGSHRARINTFPEKEKAQIMEILSGWLYE